MSFIITVVEVKHEPKKSKQWLKVADTGNKRDGKAVYDYVESDVIERSEKELYKQEVNDIDLVSIITAVNVTPEGEKKNDTDNGQQT